MFSLLKTATRQVFKTPLFKKPTVTKFTPIAKPYSAFNMSNFKDSILQHKMDMYSCATISPANLPTDPLQFDSMLQDTLAHFEKSKVRGIWLRLDLPFSNLIPTALKHEFTLHHAKNNYVLLSKWIPKGEKNSLPNFTTHFIGIGGAVVNEATNEILVIQEKFSYTAKDLWKLPGGMVDQGELISEAAPREVFEETGIKSEFKKIIAFREKLKFRWDQPDIYFVALLKPLTFDIKHDPGEVKQAKWMKIDEYIEQEMIVSQKKTAEVLGYIGHQLKEKGNVDDFGYTGDRFSIDIGIGGEQDNIYYTSNAVRDWNAKRKSNS